MTDNLPISNEQHKRLRRDLEQAKDSISSALREMDGVLPSPRYTADERKVFEWLERQPGRVTAQQVARAVFPERPLGKPLSMTVSHYLRAAGWRPSRKSSGNRYWERGVRAQSERVVMPTPDAP